MKMFLGALYSSPKPETVQMSIIKRMDRQRLVHSYKGYTNSHSAMKINTATLTNMDETHKHNIEQRG